MDRVQRNTKDETVTELDKKKELRYTEQTLVALIKQGGKTVSSEHGKARLEVCKTRRNGRPCEHFGEVEPVPGVICTGCTSCGCALLAKAFMEYVGIKQINKKITCPHKLGNQWAQIDDTFFKSKK